MTMVTDPAALDYSDQPTVLIFTESEAGHAEAVREVRAIGGRVSAVLPIAAALDRLATQPAVAAVVVELESDGGRRLDQLLDRLDEHARSGRHGSIVIVPRQLIDIASARIRHERVTLLCEPDAVERIAALATALARPVPRLADINSDNGGARLKELSEEVARIARALATMATEDPPRPPNGPTAPSMEGNGWPVDAALIRALIRVRRMRAQYFSADLFADPAWDMLLDLTAARLEGRAVAVSSLCIASAVPPTTALRWIKTLTDSGLFARVADSTDGRRIFIELTDDAAAGMIGYLSGLQKVLAVRS